MPPSGDLPTLPPGMLCLKGFHSILSTLRADPASIEQLFVAKDRHDSRLREALQLAAHIPCRRLSMTQLNALSGRNHQGIVACLKEATATLSLDSILQKARQSSTQPLLLALDGVTDPHNLGACLRNADAAGTQAVIVPKDRACGLNSTVLKVACGAAQHIPFITVVNLARTLRQLKAQGLLVIGAQQDARSQPLSMIDQTQPLVWVMGSESKGLRRLVRESCDVLAHIPMHGTVESLNVSVASGICLYETCQQRSAASARAVQAGPKSA